MPALARNPVCPYGPRTVASAGTPVRLFTDAELQLASSSLWPTRFFQIYIEALSTNTGKIYIGVLGLTKATGVGVLFTLPIPAAGTAPSILFPAMGLGINAYDPRQYYIDSGVNSEGVIRTAWVA